jgi:hypothetical protein
MAGSPLTDLPDHTSRRGLLVGVVLGLPVVAYGIRGVLIDADDTHPAELARWVIGAALAHDLVVAPTVLAAAWALSRIVPVSLWPPVRWGVATSAILVLVSWPLVRGYGEDPTTPSLLPRNYATGLAAAIVIVWLTVIAWLGARAVAAKHTAQLGGGCRGSREGELPPLNDNAS